MLTVTHQCEQCDEYAQVEIRSDEPIMCPECKLNWGNAHKIETIFDRCPICLGNQFYSQKDFSQALGCLIMLIGICLVPFTYGLSLPVFAAFDWLLAKKVATMVVCYRCESEFRGFKVPEHLKPFMHHIGVRYDKRT